MAHVITVLDEDQSFECDESQHLLQGMQRFRLGRPLLQVIPVGCRGGGCGVCRIRVHGGNFEAMKMSCKHISETDRAQGIVLACRVYPRSDMSIRVLPETNSQ